MVEYAGENIVERLQTGQLKRREGRRLLKASTTPLVSWVARCRVVCSSGLRLGVRESGSGCRAIIDIVTQKRE